MIVIMFDTETTNEIDCPFCYDLGFSVLDTDNGKTLEIKAKGVSDENRYIKSITLNGKPYSKTYLMIKLITTNS